jgi:hypothetical protein
MKQYAGEDEEILRGQDSIGDATATRIHSEGDNQNSGGLPFLIGAWASMGMRMRLTEELCPIEQQRLRW